MERNSDEHGSPRDDEPDDDTSGGPLSSGAGEGSGQDAAGAPDVSASIPATVVTADPPTL